MRRGEPPCPDLYALSAHQLGLLEGPRRETRQFLLGDRLRQEQRKLEVQEKDLGKQQEVVSDIKRLEQELRDLECEVFEEACD